MKKIVTFLCLILVALSVSAKDFDINIIHKKWTIDLKVITPTMNSIHNKRQNMTSLHEANHEAAIPAGLNQIANNTIEYKTDRTRIGTTPYGIFNSILKKKLFMIVALILVQLSAQQHEKSLLFKFTGNSIDTSYLFGNYLLT